MFINGKEKAGEAKVYLSQRELELEKELEKYKKAYQKAMWALDYIIYDSPNKGFIESLHECQGKAITTIKECEAILKE